MVKSTIKSILPNNQSMDKLKVNNNKLDAKNFETLFAHQIGLNDRLIADYSGAILSDMVISGRLYITPSHLCFYGSLLKWETKISILLTDISSIIKARTIKVIPNAIQIVTRTGDKYVFTSLTSRHKVYLTLVSAWTANLSRNLLNYDSEAGKLSKDSSIRKCYSNLEPGSKRIIDNQTNRQAKTRRKFFSTGDLTDIKFNPNCGNDSTSSTSECSEVPSIDKPIRDPTKCPYNEPCLVDVVLPINLNRLFEMLFTDSSFSSILAKSLKHTITINREWSKFDGTDLQSNDSVIAIRQLSREMILDYPFAKNMASQEMLYLQHLDASNFYGIKLISESSGIPLCSLFHVVSCYCLHRTTNQSETHFHFHYKIVFKSKAWGFKAFIEEGTKRACLDYIESLIKMVKQWAIDNPDYVNKMDLPSQLMPFCSSISNNEMPKCEVINETPSNAKSVFQPSVSTLKRSKVEENGLDPFKVDSLSPVSSKDEKSSVSHSLCEADCEHHHVLNIVRYLKPFIALLSLLTIVNLFLMARLMNNQILSCPSCPSNQVSPSLIGLSNSEETFESLSNYAYPSLGCHG